jgi:Ser/Thr protein kinase RdoA (MazF antagonist)
MVGRASHHYGLEIDQWKVMGGYGGDWNVKLQAEGCAWTMKVSGSYRTEERLLQENDILQYLDDRHEGVSYPVPVQTVKGEKVVFEAFEGQVYGLRVLKFIEGVELSKYKG